MFASVQAIWIHYGSYVLQISRSSSSMVMVALTQKRFWAKYGCFAVDGHNWLFTLVQTTPGRKGSRNRVIFSHKYHELARKLLAPNHSFSRCDRQRRQQVAAAILCMFKPSATKLDRPRALPARNLLCQNANVINFCTAHFGHDRWTISVANACAKCRSANISPIIREIFTYNRTYRVSVCN